MLLENYKVAMSTLQVLNETEESQHPSAQTVKDLNIQEVVVNEEEDDENDGEDERDKHILGPRAVFCSADDVDDLHKEWQATHQQEMIELQRNMHAQLNAQAAKSRAQQNLGSTAQYPATETTLTGQPGLSTNAPVFVPGQAMGMGTMFYNSTP